MFTLVSKYQYYGFWEYPTIIIIPVFFVVTTLYLFKQKKKDSKILFTSILFIILTIPLFILDDYMDRPPNQYISYKWFNKRENQQIIFVELPAKYEFEQTVELNRIASKNTAPNIMYKICLAKCES